MAKTSLILIEQKVLEPWKGQLDIYDAALINHVHVRLSRRKNQKTIIHEGVSCVWIHYPTVREENWLIDLGPDAIKKRFAKLAKLGLLVHKRVSHGKDKGSQSFFGISDLLKGQYEKADQGDEDTRAEKDQGDDGPCQTFEGDDGPGAFEGDEDTAQSLSLSLSTGVEEDPPVKTPDKEPEPESPAAAEGQGKKDDHFLRLVYSMIAGAIDNPSAWMVAVGPLLATEDRETFLGALEECVSWRPDKLLFFKNDYPKYRKRYLDRNADTLRIEREGASATSEMAKLRKLKETTYDETCAEIEREKANLPWAKDNLFPDFEDEPEETEEEPQPVEPELVAV